MFSLARNRTITYGDAEFGLKQELNAIAFSRYYVLDCIFSNILEGDVFNYIGKYVNHGMCYEAAAAIMIALHDFPESRLVQAQARSALCGCVSHAWVELRYHGHDLVIDPCWITSAVPPNHSTLGSTYFAYREEFYELTKPYGSVFILHKDFWRYSLSNYLHELFRQPHVNVEQSMLLSCYRPCSQVGIGFNSLVDEVVDNADLQQEAIRQLAKQNVWPSNLHGIMSDYMKRHAG